MSKITPQICNPIIISQAEFDVAKKAKMLTDLDIENGAVIIVAPKHEAQIILESRLASRGMLKYPIC
jgi:hypothetical protein